MKLTPFGKAVRRHRTNGGVRLINMAAALGVSSAYLSAVETGGKKVNDALVEKAIGYFRSLGIDAMDLRQAAVQSHEVHTLDVTGYDESSRELMAALARRFSGGSDLPQDAKEQLKKLLETPFDD